MTQPGGIHRAYPSVESTLKRCGAAPASKDMHPALRSQFNRYSPYGFQVIGEDPDKLGPLVAAGTFTSLVTALVTGLGYLSHTYTPFSPVAGGFAATEAVVLEAAVTFASLVMLSRTVEVLLMERDAVLRYTQARIPSRVYKSILRTPCNIWRDPLGR
eukprot:5061771-Pyramimonas_sp.AAC.1